MYVNAVSSFFNPYDVARVVGVRARPEQTETNARQATQQAQPERVIQGEVLSRERLQNNKLSSTNDALSNRQYNSNQNQQQSGFGFNSNQAINTYLSNQASGERTDRQSQADNEQLIDVYV